MDMRKYQGEPKAAELFVSIYDVENFIEFARKVRARRLFAFLNELAGIASRLIEEAGGYIVKCIGDSGLIVFPAGSADASIRALMALKKQLESHLKDRGINNTISFSASLGTVVAGFMGTAPFRYLAAIGDVVQEAFYINGKPAKGRFTITESLFGELDQQTRTSFEPSMTPRIFVAQDREGNEH
jgi:class 3 adenylate cyclase